MTEPSSNNRTKRTKNRALSSSKSSSSSSIGAATTITHRKSSVDSGYRPAEGLDASLNNAEGFDGGMFHDGIRVSPEMQRRPSEASDQTSYGQGGSEQGGKSEVDGRETPQLRRNSAIHTGEDDALSIAASSATSTIQNKSRPRKSSSAKRIPKVVRAHETVSSFFVLLKCLSANIHGLHRAIVQIGGNTG